MRDMTLFIAQTLLELFLEFPVLLRFFDEL